MNLRAAGAQQNVWMFTLKSSQNAFSCFAMSSGYWSHTCAQPRTGQQASVRWRPVRSASRQEACRRTVGMRAQLSSTLTGHSISRFAASADGGAGGIGSCGAIIRSHASAAPRPPARGALRYYSAVGVYTQHSYTRIQCTRIPASWEKEPLC